MLLFKGFLVDFYFGWLFGGVLFFVKDFIFQFWCGFNFNLFFC